MTRLARRFGAEPSPCGTPASATLSIEALALENAVEGCVRETFGALLAAWQACHADDPEVRRSFRRIAVDETRHAALAWAIAAWLERALDARARARVSRARRKALRDLAVQLSRPVSSDLATVAGAPRAFEARALLVNLKQTLAA
jgi:hypothetical protein